MNVFLETDFGNEHDISASIESEDGRPNLAAIARTSGFTISIDNGRGDSLLLHTTVEFADRLARTLRREVTAWRKRTERKTS